VDVLIRESKHHQTRLVPLPKTARSALKTYLSLRRSLLRGLDHSALFLTQQGERWKQGSISGFFKMLNWNGFPNGRNLHRHIFWHSIAVYLLRWGTDVRYI
jgi:site-specific recombinase XerD